MKINVKVTGLKEMVAALNDIVKDDSQVEGLLKESMERIQLGAFKNAPYLTGLLSSSLMASENVKVTRSSGTIQVELIESIPYATIQEFTNRTKPAFIRTSTDVEFPVVMRSFNKWAKALGKGVR